MLFTPSETIQPLLCVCETSESALLVLVTDFLRLLLQLLLFAYTFIQHKKAITTLHNQNFFFLLRFLFRRTGSSK